MNSRVFWGVIAKIAFVWQSKPVSCVCGSEAEKVLLQAVSYVTTRFYFGVLEAHVVSARADGSGSR